MLLLLLSILLNGPTVVSSNEIKREVETFVRQHVKVPHENLVLEFRNLPDSIVLAEPYSSIQIGENRTMKFLGNMSLPVRFINSGRVTRSQMVSVTVRIFDDVYVGLSQIERNTVVHQNDFQIERRELTNLPDDVVTALDEIKGKRAKRIIRKDQVLCKSLLEAIPVIQSGNIVNLILKSGMVKLSTKGIAKSDGLMGEIITVQKIGSNDKFKGKILNAETVMVNVE